MVGVWVGFEVVDLNRGLKMENGLTNGNGVTNGNGITDVNGLTSGNGMTNGNGLTNGNSTKINTFGVKDKEFRFFTMYSGKKSSMVCLFVSFVVFFAIFAAIILSVEKPVQEGIEIEGPIYEDTNADFSMWIEKDYLYFYFSPNNDFFGGIENATNVLKIYISSGEKGYGMFGINATHRFILSFHNNRIVSKTGQRFSGTDTDSMGWKNFRVYAIEFNTTDLVGRARLFDMGIGSVDLSCLYILETLGGRYVSDIYRVGSGEIEVENVVFNPSRDGDICIDGRFDDWSDIPLIVDEVDCINPEIDIVGSKLYVNEKCSLYLNTRDIIIGEELSIGIVKESPSISTPKENVSKIEKESVDVPVYRFDSVDVFDYIILESGGSRLVVMVHGGEVYRAYIIIDRRLYDVSVGLDGNEVEVQFPLVDLSNVTIYMSDWQDHRDYANYSVIQRQYEPTRGSTIEVGPGKTYSTIQAGINAASDGDTVMVYDDTYQENVIVNKTINLTGESNTGTIIDASGNDGIKVENSSCNISTFRITNVTTILKYCITMLNTATNLNISDCRLGGSEGTTNYRGINCYASGLFVYNCNLSHFSNIAVWINVDNVNVSRCDFYNDTGNNIQVGYEGHTIQYCSFTKAGIGITFITGDNTTIHHCHFNNCTNRGISILSSCRDNIIYNNDFADNVLQASDLDGSNTWNLSAPTGGNWWDNHTSPDTTPANGFVDSPIGLGSGSDDLPFTAPISGLLSFAPRTFEVDDDGGKDYTVIQDAIDACRDGETVYVYSGVYTENLAVNKAINLTGQSNVSTVVDGGGTNTAVSITSDWVNMTNFRIIDVTSVAKYGIYVNGANCNVSGCHVHQCYVGVSVVKNFASIYNCKINNSNTIDLQLTGHYFTIRKCEIYNCTDRGIDLGITSSARNSVIEYNNIYGCGGASGKGIYALISTGANLTIRYNEIHNNTYGIYLSSSGNILIYNNNFRDNTNHAWCNNLNNDWNLSSPDGGNYWDNWTSPDGNHDGFVDDPFNITGGSAQDELPLVYPYGYGAPSGPVIPDYSTIYVLLLLVPFMAVIKSRKHKRGDRP